ncbi:hypothetical protein Kpol_367p4 [Vanderwaltozyma polyspora DSM 70294]|uniref:JmjC domain-containing protein n=1 Tax=Vanderwaltozyma polyspora (strain ATCC 22028 / DSM 70294 / BCRC 21397 / CBS 2163 / NBRC 10782 / NRRL Y-8283 / UCD 57-17) TaxID=436907 RepID=A7TRQ5_VANPO|nr:uncharacterized protein Kpol_367p4 [Vanderwaltozyma polyspora DSM 70294]EDO15049.1 hypothetical protein Kpol_367p4 [Vanderwaltozyma polyspora DSM 70294]
MVAKRQTIDESSGSHGSKKALDLDSKLTSRYTAYYPEEHKMEIDVIDVPQTEEEQLKFFNDYVALRKPCKIRGVSPKGFPLDELKYENVTDFLDKEEVLQIEKKVDGGFGSGTKRLKMTFEEFMESLTKKEETGLYLTTQYYEDDPENGNYSSDEDEKDQVIDENFKSSMSDVDSLINIKDMHDDFDELEPFENEEDEIVEDELRIRELYQPPMINLAKTLPETPEFLKYLIPQQINLWIGATSRKDNIDFAKSFQKDTSDKWMGLGRNIPGDGSSSGLHHDHADNIYIPISGHKRFTLFSPGDAAKMYTVGDIRQIYNSGIIDYVRNSKAPNWRQLRDDGAIVAEVYKKYLEQDNELSDSDKAKYEKFIELDNEEGSKYTERDILYLDPPSFSTIPPAFVHIDEIADERTRSEMSEVINVKWPLFKNANRITVDIKAGEMLYLPTGWFHEVTSYGDENNTKTKNHIHVAVNYWFVPPNGDKIDNVYSNADKYWLSDYERTKESLERLRSDDTN